MAKTSFSSPANAKKKADEPSFAVINAAGAPVYGSFRHENGECLFLSDGSSLRDAVRLARGLAQPAGVAQIGPDRRLYRGKVEFENNEPISFVSPHLPAESDDEDA